MIVELYNDLLTRLPPGTPLYLGRQHLAQHDRPPRLVLVPVSERFIPPDRPQPQPGRVLWTREVGLELHLWGQDYAQLEALLSETVTALTQSLGTSLRLESATWEPEGWDQLGTVIVLNFSVAAPLLRAEAFAELEQITQECGGFI
ncbi:MAG: hypothetical protein N2313_04550 [Meiothermus ruber]|uniref:hypothetical protein n=1 Tax=Meiothermus sp. TaxID=1955249 RepID=UPI0025EB0CA2|nr:hypothetical protein [Meiothermus sp.]MCS7069093.1 hypothetical protein [Meiothermus sp.]MCX7802274.1 hypothetical protein [Meiothermus ruber]